MESIYDGINFEVINVDGKKDYDLKIFALSTCGHCRRAKDFLTEKGIKFEYVYVDQLEYEKKQDLKNKLQDKFKKRVAFPFLVINDEDCVVGFLKNEYIKYC